MSEIKEVLMRRDGLTEAQADKRIKRAKIKLQMYLKRGDIERAEYICEEEFGLEPDYIYELL